MKPKRKPFDIISDLFNSATMGKELTSKPILEKDSVSIKDGDLDIEMDAQGKVNKVNSLPNITQEKIDYSNKFNFPTNAKDTGSSIGFPPNAYSYEWKNVSTGTGTGSEIFPRTMLKSSAQKLIPQVQDINPSTKAYDPKGTYVYTPTQAEGLRRAVYHWTKPINPLWYMGKGAQYGPIAGGLSGLASFGTLGALGSLGYDWITDSGERPKDSLLKGALLVGIPGALLGAMVGQDNAHYNKTYGNSADKSTIA